jgi:hypothetical protein
MAADTQARMQFSIKDARGLRSSLEIPMFIDGAQTFTAAGTAWAAQLALLEAITGGQVVGGGVTAVQPASSTGGRPAADSRVQEIGTFTEGNASNSADFGIAVPTLLDSVLTTDHTAIDVGNAAIIAWRASLLAAVLGGNFTNREYETLTKHIGTLYSFRKRRSRKLVGRTVG